MDWLHPVVALYTTAPFGPPIRTVPGVEVESWFLRRVNCHSAVPFAGANHKLMHRLLMVPAVGIVIWTRASFVEAAVAPNPKNMI